MNESEIPETDEENSTEEDGTKFCKNCSHVIGVRYRVEDADDWKCGAEENRAGFDLVTGTPVYKQTCRELRIEGSGCGLLGLWYEKYEPPKRDEEEPVTRRTKVVRSADELLDKLL